MTFQDALERRDGICTKCGQWKRPTKAYMALLKSQDRPYVCSECRAKLPPPPMDLGKLGRL
jgi:hypothetical protein